jgi:F-type H+-transporting ATPase subunit epsilon
VADASLFWLELVTPERILFAGLASEVVLRTGEGDASFLAGHAALVGSVEPGVVVVTSASGEDVRVAVHGGFVQVEHDVSLEGITAEADEAVGVHAPALEQGTRITLLAGIAELAGEIDVERARTALAGAEARVAELGGGGRTGGEDGDAPDTTLAEAEAEVRRAQVRLEAVDVATASA